MDITELEFGSFLTYSPKGDRDEQKLSRTAMSNLKNDQYVNSELMSDFISDKIKTKIDELPFRDFFGANTILVPTPTSSFTKSGTLWVPYRLADALVKQGLGKSVESCVQRVIPLRKSSLSPPNKRPKAIEHYESMKIQKTLHDPDEILLVDDIITRGATFIGAANKLAEAFPKARIRAFAFMRTISNPLEFVKTVDPCIGTIVLRDDGNTLRRP